MTIVVSFEAFSAVGVEVDTRIERPAPQGRPFCYSVVRGLGD